MGKDGAGWSRIAFSLCLKAPLHVTILHESPGFSWNISFFPKEDPLYSHFVLAGLWITFFFFLSFVEMNVNDLLCEEEARPGPKGFIISARGAERSFHRRRTSPVRHSRRRKWGLARASSTSVIHACVGEHEEGDTVIDLFTVLDMVDWSGGGSPNKTRKSIWQLAWASHLAHGREKLIGPRRNASASEILKPRGRRTISYATYWNRSMTSLYTSGSEASFPFYLSRRKKSLAHKVLWGSPSLGGIVNETAVIGLQPRPTQYMWTWSWGPPRREKPISCWLSNSLWGCGRRGRRGMDLGKRGIAAENKFKACQVRKQPSHWHVWACFIPL